MPYDENLAHRLRSLIEPLDHFEEKKMFGGIAFLYKGKMTVGIIKDELCARYLESVHPSILTKEGVRPMDFTGKPLKDFVYVNQDALQSKEDLLTWLKLGIEHAESKL
jgi:TfoX/Sxy family transcriptional regulator of competence genes